MRLKAEIICRIFETHKARVHNFSSLGPILCILLCQALFAAVDTLVAIQN